MHNIVKSFIAIGSEMTVLGKGISDNNKNPNQNKNKKKKKKNVCDHWAPVSGSKN